MSASEKLLTAAVTIEYYGNVMKSKGLRERAAWAYAEAKILRDLATKQEAPAMAFAA